MPGAIPTPQRSPGLAGSRLRAKPVILLTQTYLTSSTNAAGAASALAGGNGTWTNPSNATTDNAAAAVWARP